MVDRKKGRNFGSSDMQADKTGPKTYARLGPVWRSPKFKEKVEHRGESAPRSPTGPLIEAFPSEASMETFVHRSRPKQQPRGPARVAVNAFADDSSGIREHFIRALARWRASRDFQDWIEFGQHERRWRPASTFSARTHDLNTPEYFDL